MSGSKKKRHKYDHREEKSNNLLKILVILAIVLFFVFVFAGDWILGQIPRNDYIKDLKVAHGAIAEWTIEEGKYYARVNLDYSSGITNYNQDALWIETKPEFYKSKYIGSKVGVLAAHVVSYRAKYFGIFGKRGQKFDKNYWELQHIYPTYEEAIKANPEKEFTADATIKKKKAAVSGNKYFVLEYDGRDFSTQVESQLYNKYNVGKSLKCKFKSIGELVKLTEIVVQ